jgi:hypothetical protein
MSGSLTHLPPSPTGHCRFKHTVLKESLRKVLVGKSDKVEKCAQLRIADRKRYVLKDITAKLSEKIIFHFLPCIFLNKS